MIGSRASPLWPGGANAGNFMSEALAEADPAESRPPGNRTGKLVLGRKNSMIELTNWRRLMGIGVGLLATWLFIADAQARIPLRRPGAKRTNGGLAAGKANGRAGKGAAGANAQQMHKLIQELQGAKYMLEQAKHDYDGHRVKAIHQINLAIQAIHQHHGLTAGKGAGGAGKKVAGGGGTSTGTASKESQPQSDAMLRQARQHLFTIHGQMQAAHHPKAKGHVQLGVQHLDTALKIR